MEEGSTIKIGGSMAQYAITNAYQCVPLKNNTSFNEGASFFVNPLSAIGLVEQVTKGKGRSVVITACASQLGKMMIRLFHEKNIEVIATVRKEDQLKDLKENFKVKHVLNSENEDFYDKFKELVTKKDTKHLLECIGGPVFGKLVSRMPKKSTVILYGTLSRANCSEIDPFALIGKDMVLKGFSLNVWIEKKSLLSKMNIVKKVGKMIKENLSTNIQKEFDLADIKEAKEFYESNMSGGKVILKPWGVDPK